MPSVSTKTSTTTTALPPRKRQRRESKDSQENETKGARGRPRVESHDETAADRRRTQIRLAQRAYRMRKESTITSLQQKVTELSNVVEQMTSTFLGFHDVAQGAGLGSFNPQLSHDLQQASRRFLLLAEQVDTGHDSAGEHAEHDAHSKGDRSTNGGSSPSETSQQSPCGLIEPSLEQPDASMHHIGLGVFAIQEEIEEVERRPAKSNSVPLSAWTQDHPLFLNDADPEPIEADPILGALVRMPSPFNGLSTTRGMPSMFTYSFEESTFARRIHRACLERAFYLLSTPNHRCIKDAFKLLLPFKGADEIRELCRERLVRGVGEPLESSSYYPFSNLGGAGTHYPHLPSQVLPASIPSPKLLAWLKTQASAQHVSDNIMHVPVGKDLEGVWFDPQDVEGFLAEHGVYIPPQSYFTEAWVNDDSFLHGVEQDRNAQRENGTESTTNALFGQDSSSRSGAELYGQIIEELSNQTGRFEGEDLPIPDVSSATGFQVPAPPLSDDAPMTTPKRIVIDVSKFVDGLVSRGICLGRTPGYRRRDVEIALRKAITPY